MKKQLNEIVLEGKSRAAEQTYFRLPQFQLGFDVGKGPSSLISCKDIFLSHLHADHCAGIRSILSERKLRQSSHPLRIYLPLYAKEKLDSILQLWQELDRREYDYQLIGVEHGKDFWIRPHLRVRAFSLYHRIPTFGYTLYQKKQTLPPLHRSKSQQELLQLQQEGVPNFQTHEVPLLSYFTDTTIQALEEYPHVFQSSILILECTFWEADHHKFAEKTGHIHLQDIAQRASSFQNDYLVLIHVSLRYSPKRVRALAKEILPPTLQKKLILWLE
ncbi:MAG: hypothetical protein D6805_03125 [Planctomycetota bacterium]|nr:MAG: hypothetical protein D6805_03125 [Planctomycetota bacterium]